MQNMVWLFVLFLVIIVAIAVNYYISGRSQEKLESKLIKAQTEAALAYQKVQELQKQMQKQIN